jgi:hypothetical protein
MKREKIFIRKEKLRVSLSNSQIKGTLKYCVNWKMERKWKLKLKTSRKEGTPIPLKKI